MSAVFCIMIFIMGTIFGSFFTLGVYRIPLGLDITHERSFCPNCKHKLKFIDLIPVFSYIFLHGKCRYCGNKIRIRYFILEILSGFVFLIAYLSYNMNFPFIELEEIIYFANFVFFYVTIVLISGIDKENIRIEKSVLLFGIIMQSIYMIYLCILGASMYRYIMCLVIMIILFIIDTVSLKIKSKTYYLVQILMYVDYILMYIPFNITYIIAILSIIFVLIYSLYKKIKNKSKTLFKENKIGIGFCIGIASVLTVIINNFVIFYI